jgi:hypothetical protein
MKIFETVDDYLKEAKENDIIVLGGRGLMNGIVNINSKHDTHKVVKGTTINKIVVREFRGRTNLTLAPNSHDQQVALLTNKEFKNLKTLW